MFPELVSRGWEIWGVEPSPTAVALAEEQLAGAGTVITALAEDVELPARSFQRISLQHVVEHLRDPALVLRRAREWIAPDGTLVITCPNFACWERRAFRRFWFGLDVPRHLYHFTPTTLPHMLEQASWRVASVRADHTVTTLAGTMALVLDLARGGRHEWRDFARMRRPVELVEHIAYVVGAKPSIEVVAEPL
jgi:2-polyprenyl-3-methyl-5-hydroxy-6-metoxy-1,4-benzoquinol methylase